MSTSKKPGHRLTYSVERDETSRQIAGLDRIDMQFRETRRSAAALAQRLADRDGCDYAVTTWRCSNTVLMDAETVGVQLVVSPA